VRGEEKRNLCWCTLQKEKGEEERLQKTLPKGKERGAAYLVGERRQKKRRKAEKRKNFRQGILRRRKEKRGSFFIPQCEEGKKGKQEKKKEEAPQYPSAERKEGKKLLKVLGFLRGRKKKA